MIQMLPMPRAMKTTWTTESRSAGALVQPRDEVGHRDVDHARRGEGEDLGDPFGHGREREVRR